MLRSWADGKSAKVFPSSADRLSLQRVTLEEAGKGGSPVIQIPVARMSPVVIPKSRKDPGHSYLDATNHASLGMIGRILRDF